MSLRNFGLAACFILAFTSATIAQTSMEHRLARIDSLITNLNEKQQSMGSVALFQNGKAVYEKAFGYMDDEDGTWTPADLETRYRIGSITKTFTAVLTLKLVEEGLIDLDTKVAEYFPDVPNADKITVEHLLRHRSGLFNITNSPDFIQWMTEPHNRAQMMDRIEGVAVNFEPGSKFEYSNTGYILLGFMLEEASSMKYADLIEEYIATPLDLAATYVGDSDTRYPEEARSFRMTPEGWIRGPLTHMGVPAAAGAIVSTPSEVATFFHAIFEGDLLTAEQRALMTNLVEGYGFAMINIPFGTRIGFGHSGGIDNFTALAGHFPNEEVTFAILNNGTVMSTNEIAIGLLSIWFDAPYQIPTFEAVEMSEEDLDRYVGTYGSENFPLDITVMREGKQLFAQATGQSRFPLTPSGKDEFRYDGAAIKMTFKPEDGSLVMQQGGVSVPYKRKSK